MRIGDEEQRHHSENDDAEQSHYLLPYDKEKEKEKEGVNTMIKRWKLKPLGMLCVLVALAAFGMGAACETTPYARPCRGPSGDLGVCGGVILKWSIGTDPFDAYQMFTTREVDPAVYSHDPTSTPTATITVTLTDASTVSHNQTLYFDTGTSIPPITPGHVVLVYRPTDPAGLQAFIDQYRSSAASAEEESRVFLLDVSGGSIETSVVDFQGKFNSDPPRYTGSVNTSPPSRDCPPRCPLGSGL